MKSIPAAFIVSLLLFFITPIVEAFNRSSRYSVNNRLWAGTVVPDKKAKKFGFTKPTGPPQTPPAAQIKATSKLEYSIEFHFKTFLLLFYNHHLSVPTPMSNPIPLPVEAAPVVSEASPVVSEASPDLPSTPSKPFYKGWTPHVNICSPPFSSFDERIV